MKKIYSILAATFFSLTVHAANKTFSVPVGNTNDPSSWSPAGVPTASDTIIFPAGSNATVNANLTVARIVYNGGAGGNILVDINPGVTLQVGTGFSTRSSLVMNPSTSDGSIRVMNVGNGTLICSDIIMGNPGNNTRYITVLVDNGLITVRRDFTPLGANNENLVTVLGTGTIEVGDDFLSTGANGTARGSFAAGNGTVIFNGDFGVGRQFVPAHTYNNIEFQNSQRKFFTGGGTAQTTILGNVVCNNQVGTVLPLGQSVDGSGEGTVELGNPIITVKGTFTINAGAIVTDSSGTGRLICEGLLTIDGGILRADHPAAALNTGEVILKAGLTINNGGHLDGSPLPNDGMELEFRYDPAIPGSATQTFVDNSASPQIKHIVRDFVIDSNVTVTVSVDSLFISDDIVGVKPLDTVNYTTGRFIEGTRDLQLLVLDRFFDTGLADFINNAPSTVHFGAGTKRPSGIDPGNIQLYNVSIDAEAGQCVLATDLVATNDLTVTGLFNPSSFNVTCNNLLVEGQWNDNNNLGTLLVNGDATVAAGSLNNAVRGDCIFMGDLTVDPTATFVNNGNKNLRFRGMLANVSGIQTVSGTGTINVYIENGASITFNGPVNINTGNSNFYVEDNSAFIANQAINITTNFYHNSTGTSTLFFGGLVADKIFLNAGTLDCNNQPVTITTNGNTTTAGSLNSNGGLFTNLDNLSFAGATSGSYTIIGSAPLTLKNVNGDRTINVQCPLSIEGIIAVPSLAAIVSNGNLTLLATSATNYGQIAPGAFAITGAVTVEKAMVNNNTAGWRHMAFPTTATDLKAATQGIFLRGSESGLGTSYSNVFSYYDATAGTGSWTDPNMTNVPANNLQRRAFAIYSSNGSAPFALSSTISVTGNQVSPSAVRNYPIEQWVDQAAPGPLNNDWNLIPNEYSFGLKMDEILAAGGANIQQFLRVWNSETMVYDNTPAASAAGKVIPPFHAYWVQSLVPSGTLAINPSVVGTVAFPSGTVGHKNNNFDQFDLVVQLDNGWKDKLSILFDAVATHGYDNGYEAFKSPSINPNMVNLFAVDHGDNLSWNALPYEDNQIVPVAFNGGTFGETYTFTPDFGQTTNGWQVYLKDLYTNTTTLLNGSAGYTFTHSADAPEQRFELLFTNATLSNEETAPTSKLDEVFVYQQGGENYIHFPAHLSGQATVEVIALSGQVVYTETLEITSGVTKVNFGAAPRAYYLVRIAHPEGVLTTKVAR